MPTLTVPETVASELSSLTEEQMKHRIITANGLTIAQEEEILRIEREDEISEAMTPEELFAELKSLHNEN